MYRMYKQKQQKSSFLGAFSFALISWLLVSTSQGQEDTLPPEEDTEWPVVADPFPDSDEIGPEPEPTPAPDCSTACLDNLNQANNKIDALERRIEDMNATLLQRISHLETNSNNNGGGNNEAINQHLQDIENYISGNATSLINKINNDVSQLRQQFTEDIAALRRDLETKINAIPAGGGGGGDGGKAMEVYYNLTERIRNLEMGKVQTLIVDNNLWRRNFRVINATFAKLRKSSRGNNVVLQG